MAEADETAALQYTPTWIVAAVCSIIVLISLAAERGLHHLGKTLKKNHQRPLYEALLKVKEELMLLGFISLLLTVLQGTIQRTCIPPSWTDYMLPCQRPGHDEAPAAAASMAARFVAADILGGISWARVLSEGEGAAAQAGLCEKEGKVPLLSLEALHQLHIFIFVLAVSHVFFCASTMLPGCAKIRKWKKWEEEIQKIAAENGPKKVLPMHQVSFIRERYKGIGTDSKTLCWLHSFRKQFYGSVAKSDYAAMRLGFIMTHCRGNLKFDFHRYMLALVDLRGDISAAQCQRLNGLHAYFWIAFLPLVLLLAVGTKLEHVIAQLAYDVAEKQTAIEGDLVVTPSDQHFWFGRPRIILHLIHFILFQNAFELAFFFWILMTYGLESCFMDHIGFLVPRLVLGVVIQLLCSYSTLPLYAIVTQMGSYYKKEIFNEHVQQGVLGWAQKAKKRSGVKEVSSPSEPMHGEDAA
ncbi:MLO-like protein 1 isoform X3 [Zea mays]|uniref:MLO-like protein 1 isoform X3 n=1 Tax=Zea mays TaxID=4577 RepID=UPI0004DE9466|nr:MLO-like protein 1 isoform X3 [Zea mays]|eukprot:XP_008649648.1 MLO-like protein 1 isoform X3 [Zea mays]